MAQPRTSTAKVVRSQNFNARQLRVLPNDPPDYFLADAITPDVTSLADAPEDEARLDTGAGDPSVDGQLYPGGHGDGANVAALAEQVDDCPMLISLL